nr:hypothetical protein BaRGS_005750 [Batillaria attramentaria]
MNIMADQMPFLPEAELEQPTTFIKDGQPPHFSPIGFLESALKLLREGKDALEAIRMQMAAGPSTQGRQVSGDTVKGDDQGVFAAQGTGRKRSSLGAEQSYEKCLNDTTTFFGAMALNVPWAVQMMDATGKPSSGVVTGNIQWPGAYEECLLVRALAADGVTSMFSGQYCTFSILAIPVQVNHVSSCPNDYPLDKTANIAIGVFAFFGFLVALGTAVDIVLVQMPKWRLARMPTILGAGLDTSATVITLSDIQRIIDQQTRVIDEKLGPLRADISDVRTSVQAIATDIAELKQRTLTLETSCEKLSDRHDDLVESVEDLAEDLKDLQARYEEEIDKLEAFSRRDNLRLFGLAETPNETFESCAAKVIECLQGTVPNKTWSEDDVVRAHRVGKKPNFSSVASNTTPKSRPMIVKFARWRDKMDILTKGRTALKAKGVNVAGDLTTRQHQKIQEHRDRGLRAYYKGSKLVVAGPLQQRNDIDSFGRRRQDTVSSGTVAKLLISFSLYTNGSKLLSTYQPPGSLTCVHGIRFLSMTWVVLGHTFGAVNGFADNSGPYQKKVYDDFSFGMVANATLSVDTFFLLSGLLVAYLSLKEMNKNKGHLNWPMFYFHRFWRLTPVYMMIIYFNTALTPYLATGPNAPDEDQKAAMRKPCEENWWTNMLYINNLVHGGCEGEGWYLANDMQFYLLSPLIFVPFFYSAWLGGLSAGAFLLATSITPGVLTSIKHFQPSTTAAVDEPIEPGADYMNEYYIKPYCRMGPYIVGLIAGYLLYRCGTKIRMHKVVVVVGWLAATGIAVSSLFGLYDATKFTDREPMEVWQSALYNALGRTAWSISVAWVIIACVWGYGGFVNTILSWGALVPLSRLTYCIYLIHMSAQNTLIRSFNTPFYMNSVNIVMFQFGLLVLCYFIGAIVSLTFESPMMGLEKILLHGNKKKG